MSDVSDMAAGAKGRGGKGAGGAGKGKAGGEGNAKVEGQIGRMLVRAIWGQEWSAANPDGKGEDRKAAWKDAREAALEKNLKTYRRALNALTRSGVVMTLSDDAAQASGDEDDTSAE